ncbi:hypothetical protein AK830_g12468 [Neonectria ditissima]|uniref:F-box domain-containing protein n=1 Tax=Neonectria ditissima TaxID=78410 RepID=A0A0P7B0E9_9HYPO|nr:hypothetical protein AK830_g12468 [Neonectria ditissima]
MHTSATANLESDMAMTENTDRSSGTSQKKQRGISDFAGFGLSQVAAPKRPERPAPLLTLRDAEDAPTTRATGEAEEATPTPHVTEESEAAPAARPVFTGPLEKGWKDARFNLTKEWETGLRYRVGYGTKKLAFGYGFVLEEDSANSARRLTDEAVTCLVESCPNLRRLQLQGTSGFKDSTLKALFRNCPNIFYVELTTLGSYQQLDGSALDGLRENPNWATKLKTLRLPYPTLGCRRREPLRREVRALTKERVKLLVQFVMVSEKRKWGDWELEILPISFRKGKECYEKLSPSEMMEGLAWLRGRRSF